MKIDFEEIQETIQNLDPENIGSWPTYIKAAIYVMVFVGVFALGIYFMVLEVRSDLVQQQKEEEKLVQEFEKKSFQAANLEEFKKQMEDLDGSYEALLRQLPRETEVPGLLDDITNTGTGSGLKIVSTQFGEETEVDFYSELPIDLVVEGGFHGLAGFISGVAALPRIVTLHDFVIESRNRDDRSIGTRLVMEIRAKTYRYQDEGGEG